MNCTKKPRNLVVCVDGTSNKFSDKNTNVVKLYECLRKDDRIQKTYYCSGIGTFLKPRRKIPIGGQWLINKFDQAFAITLPDGILQAYRWLADTHKDDDQIFLFGFSRGAYQVRVLAAMIECVGLIHAGNLQQIPFAWKLYSTQTSNKQAYNEKITQFKSTFSRSIEIHFLGAWDTVSSVGFIRRKLLPSALKSRHIKHFRHALALDECRVKFLPEHATDVSGGTNTAKTVWFAGTHSDIGGTKSRNASTCGAEALYWMMDEAKHLGLRLNRQDIPVCSVPAAPRKHMGLWRLLEYLPIARAPPMPDLDERTHFFSYNSLPNWGKGRIISNPSDRFHWSVIASAKDAGYNPQAVLRPIGEATLTLRDIIDKPEREVKNFCDTGYNNIKFLKLTRDITQAAEKIKHDHSSGPEPTEPPAGLLSSLDQLLNLVRLGQTKVVWIYDGPLFLLRLMLISRKYPGGEITQRCKEIVSAVVDPVYYAPWEDDLALLAEGKPPMFEQDCRFDEIDEFSLPRLHDLLKTCQHILEPSESKSPIALISQVTSDHKHTELSPDMLHDMVPDAISLALIVLQDISGLLEDYQGDIDRDSRFIKDIPLLLLPLDKNSRENRVNEVVESVIDIIVRITSFEGDIGRVCRRKLCDGIIAERLLCWIRDQKEQGIPIETKVIGAVRKLAEDPRTAAYWIHEGFVEDTLTQFTENMENEDYMKATQTLGLLATLINTSYHAFNKAKLLRVITEDMTAYLFTCMTKQDLKMETDAIIVVANLVRLGLVRDNQLPKIISQVEHVLKSINPDNLDPPSNSPGSIDVHISLLEGKIQASIRLVTELARHDASRRILIREQNDIFSTWAQLVSREKLKQEEQRRSDEESFGPITTQFIQFLPMFALYPDLKQPNLKGLVEELTKSADPLGGRSGGENYRSKILRLRLNFLDTQPGPGV